MSIDVPTIIAWVVLAVLGIAVVAAIVYLGSLPASIARKRNHPQTDAINAASWIGLALLGSGWPIAFVWAFVRQAPIGAPDQKNFSGNDSRLDELTREIEQMSARIQAAEAQLAANHQRGSEA